MMMTTKTNVVVSTPAIWEARRWGGYIRAPGSGVLHHDRLDDLRDVLAAVDAGLHLFVDLQPLEDLDRVLLGGEEPLDGALRGAVALLFERLDALDVIADALLGLEHRERLLELHDRVHQRARKLDRGRRALRDP